MIPAAWARFQLSQLINKVLDPPKPIPFDFLAQGEVVRGTLLQWCSEKGLSTEDTLELEYVESMLPPERVASIEPDNWISSISCQLPGYFLASSFDGSLQIYDNSQNLVASSSSHPAPATSVCWLPSTGFSTSRFIASASHDTTALISQIDFEGDAPQIVPLASLNVHTAPLSSISSDPSGSRLLTSSWDSLVCLWTSSVPEKDEAPLIQTQANKKRRRTEGSAVKRKAPIQVLKSHTGRVSGAEFLAADRAVSCGLDSTIRTWHLEAGVCDRTITASEKPFTGLAVASRSGGRKVFATSTDRTLSLYDVHESDALSNAATLTLMHSSLPSCVVASPSDEWRVLTGAYDGLVRIWDIRSGKTPVASFKALQSETVQKGGDGKVLSVDWSPGVVAVGGEGGIEIWRVSDEGAAERM
jgi:ribosome biogenesis protein YTM1